MNDDLTDDEAVALLMALRAEDQAKRTAALSKRDLEYRRALGVAPDQPLPKTLGRAAGGGNGRRVSHQKVGGSVGTSGASIYRVDEGATPRETRDGKEARA